MAKWFGKIGFAENKEIRPGVWMPEVTEREYYGEVTRHNRRLQSTADKVNEDITISNQLSIIADPYANENINNMRYAEIAGAKWKINTVEIAYPRLVLEIGGVYNGATPGTGSDSEEDSGV